MPLVMRHVVAALIIAVVMGCSSGSVKGVDVREQEHLCNLKVVADKGNLQVDDITNLVWWLLEQTPVQGFSQHHNYYGYHGAAACNGKISINDCDYCLDHAKSQIFNTCGYGDGAQIKLADCRLRYELYQFPDDW